MSRTRKTRHNKARRCCNCGCSDANCTECFALTGSPCYWVGPRLCSACTTPVLRKARGELRCALVRAHLANPKEATRG